MQSVCSPHPLFHRIASFVRDFPRHQFDNFFTAGVCCISGQCYCPSSMPEHESATRDLGTPRPVCVVVFAAGLPDTALAAVVQSCWNADHRLSRNPRLTGCAGEARYQTPIRGQGRTALHGSNKAMGQNGSSLLAVITKTTTQTLDDAENSRVVTSSWRCLVTTRWPSGLAQLDVEPRRSERTIKGDRHPPTVGAGCDGVPLTWYQAVVTVPVPKRHG